MRQNKKGQSVDGRYIAVLVILIAFFIVLYVLFVPPEQRNELLNQNIAGVSPGTATTAGGEELLAVSPGDLAPRKDTGQEHQMSAVNIFVKITPKIITLAQNLVVKSGWFSQQKPSVTFDVDESSMKKANFFFVVAEPSDGDLMVSLNGNTFFSGHLDVGAQIIEIPLSLVKAHNVLELKVSGPGLAFWATNKYALKDVGVKLEFERINAEESRSFTLTDKERNNLLSSKLTYFQICNEPLKEQTAKLKMYANDKNIFDGLIRCINIRQSVNIDTSILHSGQNSIRFLLEQGDFSLNELAVMTDSREAEFPTYSFVVNQDHVRQIHSGKKVMLRMIFANANQAKTARVFVGDKNFIVNTAASAFEKDVTDFIAEGTNFVRIEPSNTFEVVSLRVVLV